MIVSASRRTDVPNYYSDWFFNRLREGYALVRNPINPRQIRHVSLAPQDVDCFVFWSKNPEPMLPCLRELESRDYAYYFQFTLTPYGRELEPGLPDKSVLTDTFRRLADKLGHDRVLWRYDPIILNREWTPALHEQTFFAYCRALEGSTRVCTISFVDQYMKNRRLFQSGVLAAPDEEQMRRMAKCFAQSGAAHGIEIRSCCEPLDLTPCGVMHGSCIDRDTIEKLLRRSVGAKRDNSQRPGCGCLASVDIGAYDTCPSGCVYCYANKSNKAVQPNLGQYDPDSALLCGAAALCK